MFKKFLERTFKRIIETHVDVAVEKAEQIFGGEKGEEKKAMAVAYVMSFIKLPAPIAFLKPFISGALTSIVDKAVELAVEKLHKMQDRILAGG